MIRLTEIKNNKGALTAVVTDRNKPIATHRFDKASHTHSLTAIKDIGDNELLYTFGESKKLINATREELKR